MEDGHTQAERSQGHYELWVEVGRSQQPAICGPEGAGRDHAREGQGEKSQDLPCQRLGTLPDECHLSKSRRTAAMTSSTSSSVSVADSGKETVRSPMNSAAGNCP